MSQIEDPVLHVEGIKHDERALLDDIEDYLREMSWPHQKAHKRSGGRWVSATGSKSVAGRMNIGSGPKDAFVLGKVRKWDDHTRLYESVHNKKHPELHSMLKRLVKTHNPNFRFNAIQLNRNVETKPHYDRRNHGCSYCIALGRFTGGGLRVFDGGGNARDIDNNRKWVLYNGGTTYHASVPVRSGVRFAIIFYMYKLKSTKHSKTKQCRQS